MAAGSSPRPCTLLMPTDEPRFAGFTNTGYFSLLSISLQILLALFCHSRRNTVAWRTSGRPPADRRRANAKRERFPPKICHAADFPRATPSPSGLPWLFRWELLHILIYRSPPAPTPPRAARLHARRCVPRKEFPPAVFSFALFCGLPRIPANSISLSECVNFVCSRSEDR